LLITVDTMPMPTISISTHSSRLLSSVTLAVALATSIVACSSTDGGVSAATEATTTENVGSVRQALDEETCSSTEGISGAFIEACLLAGGDRVACSSGSAMCCRPCVAGEGCTSHCFDRISDVREAEPTKDRASSGDPPPDTIGPKYEPKAVTYPGVSGDGSGSVDSVKK
jgi:hypothetical protein